MWAYADGISKKAWQERGRSRQEKLRCKRLGRCVDPADREEKGCRCRCWGPLSRRGGGLQEQVEGLALTPGNTGGEGGGLAIKGVLPPTPAPP